MTWNFTPTQVMKGEVNYGLDEFRRDLFEQTEFNFGSHFSPERLEHGFNLFWIICHLMATTKSLDEVQSRLSKLEPPVGRELIKLIAETHKSDAEMLTAIYQNLFLRFFTVALSQSLGDEEMSIDQALAMVNLYIHRHLKIPVINLVAGGTPRKRSLSV